MASGGVMSKTAPFVIMNINMTSDNEIKSVFMGAKAVPVLHGLPGIGVVLQLHEKPIRFFLETMNRYGDRVEPGVLKRRVLWLTKPSRCGDYLDSERRRLRTSQE